MKRLLFKFLLTLFLYPNIIICQVPLGDVNYDAVTDDLDIQIIYDHFYTTFDTYPKLDLNNDNIINAIDLTRCGSDYGIQYKLTINNTSPTTGTLFYTNQEYTLTVDADYLLNPYDDTDNYYVILNVFTVDEDNVSSILCSASELINVGSGNLVISTTFNIPSNSTAIRAQLNYETDSYCINSIPAIIDPFPTNLSPPTTPWFIDYGLYAVEELALGITSEGISRGLAALASQAIGWGAGMIFGVLVADELLLVGGGSFSIPLEGSTTLYPNSISIIGTINVLPDDVHLIGIIELDDENSDVEIILERDSFYSYKSTDDDDNDALTRTVAVSNPTEGDWIIKIITQDLSQQTIQCDYKVEVYY